MQNPEWPATSAAYDRLLRPLLQKMQADLSHIRTLVDVGCGNGVMSFAFAQDLKPDRTILVDAVNRVKPEVRTLPGFRFLQLDVCEPAFGEVFANSVNVVTSFLSFHEFKDPISALKNMARALPKGGALVVIDRAEQGWIEIAQRSADSGPHAWAHYCSDRENIQKSGLGTDAGIVKFWSQVAPQYLRGTVACVTDPHAYCAIYVAGR